MNPAVIVMAKRPTPGATKTRLMPALTAEQAAALYECFLRDTLELACAVHGATRVVAYPPGDGVRYFSELARGFMLVPQIGATLSERLAHVFDHCLAAGFSPVAAIGSDSPTLPAAYVRRGLALLAAGSADLVLGPCEDGGYYLIGLSRACPRLLLGVQMSTSHVLADTLALAAEDGLRAALLPPWYDVDTAADLVRLRSDLATLPQDAARHTHGLLAG
jgi:rSAM/selenodomain-associated transferase 1